MKDRIHACLDGELAPSELTSRERARLAELEAAVDTVVTRVRSDPVPDFTAAVMRALPARLAAVPAPSVGSAWQRAFRWLWVPRAVRLTFRPAYALGAFAAVVLALIAVRPNLPEYFGPLVRRGALQTTLATPPPIYVQFRLEAPDASTVALAGSFTEWQPQYELYEIAPGVWSAMVPLPPGVHDYAFLVDGEEWVTDPAAPQIDDSFGGTNSRLSLPPLRGSA